jgi:mono/diheme cytochrome c family protein
MSKAPSLLIPFLLIAGTLGIARADDAATGEALHEKHCTRCHDDGVYFDENRRVKSHADLVRQVELCNHMVGSQLFDDEVEKVIEYLNQNYYRF